MRPEPTVIGYNAALDRGHIEYKGGPWIDLQFQHNPITIDNPVNGMHNEDVINVLILRIEALNDRLPCVENEQAVKLLKGALSVLENRTRQRVEQQVEGTENPHRS